MATFVPDVISWKTLAAAEQYARENSSKFQFPYIVYPQKYGDVFEGEGREDCYYVSQRIEDHTPIPVGTLAVFSNGGKAGLVW